MIFFFYSIRRRVQIYSNSNPPFGWILVLMLFHAVLYAIKSFGRILCSSYIISDRSVVVRKMCFRMVSVCVYCNAGTTQYVSDVNNAFLSERHVLLFRSYLLLLRASVHSVCALVRARSICYLLGYRLPSKSCFDEVVPFRWNREKKTTAKKKSVAKQTSNPFDIFHFHWAKKKKSTNIQNLMKFYRLFSAFIFIIALFQSLFFTVDFYISRNDRASEQSVTVLQSIYVLL